MNLNLMMFCVFLAIGTFSMQAANAPVSDETLAEIKFDQKLNNQIPLDLVFRDETGKPVVLGDYLGHRPAILVLGYYECPMLCSLMLNGLVEAMQDIRLDPGKDFEIINISVDPNEKPPLAAAKKQTYLKRYGRHGAAQGWHFLTGDAPAIHKLTEETGFRFVYDPRSKQFAHPSGLVILMPDGKIARYIFGVTFSSKELDSALRDAGAGKAGSPLEQFVLLCFHYSPITGKYGKLIMASVRVSGVAMLAVLGLIVLRCKPKKTVEMRGGRA